MRAMSGDVEFESEDESIIVRDITPVAAPMLPSVLIHLHIAKNLSQANKILAGITVISALLTFGLIAEAFMGDPGQLERYPAQDVSKGV